jgi:uncharacterized SAM-binding protein YcdF (DUF218 family)
LELGFLKPVLTALVLPPASLVLLAFLGCLLALRRRAAGSLLALTSLIALWLLSCNAVAVWLASVLLNPYPPATPQSLKAAKVQAVIVLGAGIQPHAREYGQPMLQAMTASRVNYGAWLARQTGLPLGFAGGVGWAHASPGVPTEAAVVRRVVQDELRLPLRWAEDQSRDTAENGTLMAAILQRDGITRIALVTNEFHMPRALHAFAGTGIQPIPAPMGYIESLDRPILDWLPSTTGLGATRLVLHEWLGLHYTQWLGR